MELKEILEDQIRCLDNINQGLAEQVTDKTATWPIGEIRQNTELIRGLVQDILTIDQRLTIEDAKAIMGKIEVQDNQLITISKELDETREGTTLIAKTLEKQPQRKFNVAIVEPSCKTVEGDYTEHKAYPVLAVDQDEDTVFLLLADDLGEME